MLRVAFVILLSFLALPSLAETRYINDELRVPLRKSPCNRCAIVHRGLKSGLALNVIETSDGWSHVTTPGGLEGWMESQYLVGKPIARTRVADLEKKHSALASQFQDTENALKAARAEAALLEERLASLQQHNASANEELAEIKEVSASAISLHTQNQELLKQNKILQNEIDVLTARTEQLASSDTQKWFFYGSLSVVMGALLAIFLPRLKRKRRGYSEWA